MCHGASQRPTQVAQAAALSKGTTHRSVEEVTQGMSTEVPAGTYVVEGEDVYVVEASSHGQRRCYVMCEGTGPQRYVRQIKRRVVEALERKGLLILTEPRDDPTRFVRREWVQP